MTIKFLDLAKQHKQIADQLSVAFVRLLEDSAFINGPHVSEFEAAFAAYVGTRNCVGVGNGTDAITIAIEALNGKAGGEVIVPANSFIASSEAVTSAGCRVVFADVSPDSYNLDIVDVVQRISPATVGILAVHLYGNPANLSELRALCDKHSLFLLEDCAQAHGASFEGRHVGAVGDVSTFSFYPGKNLGGLGDGGAIVTNDDALARKCRMIANHGRISKYDHLFEARNSRLDGLQAALLSAKLPHLDKWVGARRVIASTYDNLLQPAGVQIPPTNPRGTHAYHLYVIRYADRDRLAAWLGEKGIETGIHYPIALPALAAYRYLGEPYEHMFAVRAAAQVLSLPIGPHLEVDDARFVATEVVRFVQCNQ